MDGHNFDRNGASHKAAHRGWMNQCDGRRVDSGEASLRMSGSDTWKWPYCYGPHFEGGRQAATATLPLSRLMPNVSGLRRCERYSWSRMPKQNVYYRGLTALLAGHLGSSRKGSKELPLHRIPDKAQSVRDVRIYEESDCLCRTRETEHQRETPRGAVLPSTSWEDASRP